MLEPCTSFDHKVDEGILERSQKIWISANFQRNRWKLQLSLMFGSKSDALLPLLVRSQRLRTLRNFHFRLT